MDDESGYADENTASVGIPTLNHPSAANYHQLCATIPAPPFLCPQMDLSLRYSQQ